MYTLGYICHNLEALLLVVCACGCGVGLHYGI